MRTVGYTGAMARDAILARAVELASVEGLEGLTIGRLAGDLEMSKSGLFGHFGSKEELQLATLDAACAIFVREVIEPAQGAAPGRERLGALCDGWVGYLEREVFPGGCFLTAASAEFDGRPGPVRDHVRAAMEVWLAELERHAEIAGAEDPAQLAFELNALAQGANLAYQLDGDRAVFTRARSALMRRLP